MARDKLATFFVNQEEEEELPEEELPEEELLEEESELSEEW